MRVSEIRIYPVKGLRGLSVAAAEVEPWGLAGDRRWMVVDANGRFLSQREAPQMARIDVEPRPGGLRLSAEGWGVCDVAVPDGPADLPVTVWRDRLHAAPADGAASRWLDAALDRAGCRLVHMADPATVRPVDPDYGAPGDHVSFADGYPLLLATTASLADLSDRVGRPLPMTRFRPNLVVDGAGPWAEDGWSALAVGAVRFRIAKPCARCVVTTVDPATGIKGADGEPLRTLADYRRDGRGRPIFGQNLIPDGPGRIAVGDAVQATLRAA